MHKMSRLIVTSALLFAAASIGCSGPAQTGTDEPTDPVAPAEEVTLTVFAAASLTSTFTELGAMFEADNPGVAVSFSFAGSSDLVAQLQQGAPGDVFASADENNMNRAVDDQLIDGDPVIFATNTLTIAVPPDNPADIAELADLTADGVQVVICAPQVPCGAATLQVEEAAGIDIQPVSEETQVTDVLAKVANGEADAGLVYSTDVQGAGDSVLGIDFPESDSAVNRYPIGVLAESGNSDLAAAFVELVTGAEGQEVLAAAGFGVP